MRPSNRSFKWKITEINSNYKDVWFSDIFPAQQNCVKSVNKRNNTTNKLVGWDSEGEKRSRSNKTHL